MATTAPSVPLLPRDAVGFGGLVPAGAVARDGETLVLAMGVEHHQDGFIVPLLVLTGAPGLLEWDPAMGLAVRDDRGDRYEARLVTATSGLGQLSASVWAEPGLPADARRLELVVDGLARINPAAGSGVRGIARPVAGGPWSLVLDLVPARTVADPPPRPVQGALPTAAASVPIRAYGAFVDLVPVGQARLSEGVAICVQSLERYWDRSVASLVALGPPGDDGAAPAIGRAEIEVWDDRGTSYEATPVQGAARDAWSEVVVELVPAIPADASVLVLQVGEVPRGAESGRRLGVPGPFVFGIRLPAA